MAHPSPARRFGWRVKYTPHLLTNTPSILSGRWNWTKDIMLMWASFPFRRREHLWFPSAEGFYFFSLGRIWTACLWSNWQECLSIVSLTYGLGIEQHCIFGHLWDVIKLLQNELAQDQFGKVAIFCESILYAKHVFTNEALHSVGSHRGISASDRQE